MEIVRATGVCKSYGGVRALHEVDIDIGAGEVHALCGENGAGKSTLIKILSGAIAPDHGQVAIGGQPLTPSVHAASALGVGVIHQESVACPDLDAVDNVYVGRELRGGGGLWLQRSSMEQQTRAWLAELGESIDVARPVGELSVAQRQMIGMARALSQRCRLLIMDEPTASLSTREAETLFGIVRRLREQGVGILYVSHRMDEIFDLADRVTVLRDGGRVGTHAIGDIGREKLIELMVGREIEPWSSDTTRSDAGPRPTLLAVRNLSRKGEFVDISFDVAAGEVVGLAGLVGAGRSEAASAVFGVVDYDQGSVVVDGEPLPQYSIAASIRRGVAFVPEDRQHLGLILRMSVVQNLSLVVLRGLTRCGLVRRRAEHELAARLAQDWQVRAARLDMPAEALSGGNQQKLVLGKWLAANPRVLLLDEPTRGVDVAAKAEIHRRIRQLASQGMATVVISSELPEILRLADRIIVLCEGRLTGELSREEASEKKILELALPVAASARRGQFDSGQFDSGHSESGHGLKRSAASLPISRPIDGATAPPSNPDSPASDRRASRDRGAAPQTPSGSAFRARLLVARKRLAKMRLCRQLTGRLRLGGRESGLLALLVLTIAGVGFLRPSFLSLDNLRDIAAEAAPTAIVACAVTLVIVTGEIDISVGSIAGFTAAVLGICCYGAEPLMSVPAGTACALAVALAVGMVNGVLVTQGKVPSIIATLGMLTILRGITKLVMQGEDIRGRPDALRDIATGKILGVPISVWLAALITIGAALAAQRTALGRRIYAVGSNVRAAPLWGVSVGWTKFFVFAFTGFLTGVATIVLAPKNSIIQPNLGEGLELLAVTCVVVGGTSISGGRGTIVGTLIAVLLLSLVPTALTFVGAPPQWRLAIQGAFILAAVLADHLAKRRPAQGVAL